MTTGLEADRPLRDAGLEILERQLQNVLRATGAATWRWNSSEQVFTFSEAFLKLIGRRPGLRLTRPQFLELVLRADRSLIERLLEPALEAVRHAQVRLLLPDQSTRWIRLSAWTCEDGSEPMDALEGIAVAVSPSREGSEDLRQGGTLQMLGQLVQGVAHDFNNILLGMMMQVDLLQADLGTDSPATEGLERLVQATDRANSLTRQLLLLSRRSAPDFRDVDLNAAIEGFLKMLRRLLGETVKVEFAPGSGLPQVKADAGLIHQLVLHLALASRPSPGHGGGVLIETGPSCSGDRSEEGASEARAEVWLRVSRRPIPDSADESKALTGQAETSLATASDIAEQHQGSLQAEEGGSYLVVLPAVPGINGFSTGLLPSGHTPCTETLLLVEDEPSLRASIAQVLSGLGYRVLEAADGAEGLAVWDRCAGQIDLLLTDLVLPSEMNGLDLALALRKRKPGLKALISSGYGERGGELVLRDGLRYLSKPYRISTLARELREYLDGPNGSAARDGNHA